LVLIDFVLAGRLAGGDNVTLHAPYMAHIQPIGPMGEMKETCGGAIINTTLILTTASCMFGLVKETSLFLLNIRISVHSTTNFAHYRSRTRILTKTKQFFLSAVAAKVKAGSPITEANETETGSQFTTATQIFYYPDYYQNTRANDIAIVRVDPPFNTTGKLKLI